MKTKVYLLFLLAILSGWSVRSQTCECETDSLSITTGFDHDANQFYSPGDQDLFWSVTTDPNGGAVPRPANVVPTRPGWHPATIDGWISPFNDGNDTNYSGGTYVFETTFCVCELTDLVFNFSTLADNGVTITLNDNTNAVLQTLQTVAAPNGFSMPTNTSSLVAGLPAGTYTIVANLMNNGGPLGLNINGSILGPGLSLRECCVAVEPEDCGDIGFETITPNCAAPWNYDYEFRIQNNDPNLTVTDALFLNVTGAGATMNPNFQSSLSISPNGGLSGLLNAVITANPQITQPTQVCFTVVLLSNGATCCEFDHCITLLPPDDPCDQISLLVQQENCCFDVNVTNNYCEDYFTAIRTTVLSAGATFNNLNGGTNWNFMANGASTTVRWEPMAGNIGLGTTPDLEFCLSGTGTMHQVQFEWLALDQNGNEIAVCREIRELECERGCLTMVEDSVICNDDGTFTYMITVTNLSTINTATHVYLSSANGISFNPAVWGPTTIPPGGSFSMTTIVTNTGGLPAGTQVPYQIVLLDINSGWCCHQTDLMFTIPDCGDCDCGTQDEFQQDLSAGFTLNGTNCSNLSVTPNAAQDCDEIIWTVATLNGNLQANGSTMGTGAWSFSLTNSGAYRICMTIVRFDDNGNFCFEGQYCEVVEISCEECIDLSLIDPNVPCPPRNRLDYVCGCDGRTYINDCTAMFRAGVTSWTPGPCPVRIPGSGVLLDGDKWSRGILLAFSIVQENTFTEYVIERRNTLDDAWTEIGVISSYGESAYEFFDEAPHYGFNEYQILAIEETGVIQYSNTAIFNFENEDLGRNADHSNREGTQASIKAPIQVQSLVKENLTILVYPNPTNEGIFQVELPYAGFTSWSLRSAQGKIVKGLGIKDGVTNFTAQLGDLSPGMYILEVTHQEPRNTDRVKVVIQ